MLQDFRHSLRLLWKNPAFTTIAVLAITLGIGANTALFSVVNSVILQPLPFADAERLVMVWESRPARGQMGNVVSPGNFLDWKSRNTVFETISPLTFGSSTLTGFGEPLSLRVQNVDSEFFPMLGIRMALGRSFTPDECIPNGPRAAILSDGFWKSRFSADPAIVGKSIRLDGEPVTVVGIAPPNTLTISDRPVALWQAIRVNGVNSVGGRASGRFLSVLGRLKPGVSLEQADSQMRTIAAQLEAEYPQFNKNWSAHVVPLASEMYGKVRTPLWVLLGAVACVLLIACANVANLLLTRAAGRSRELAVRASLGATAGTIVRQLLVESLTLASIGGFLGMALAAWMIQILKLLGPSDIRRLDAAGIDTTVLGFSIGLTLLTGLLLGLAPAITAARRTLNVSLREGGRGATAGGTTGRLRDAFTVAQVALSLILVVGAGLLLKSFAKLTAVDPGFRPDHVLTVDLSVPTVRYPDGKDVLFLSELSRQVRTLPGVVNASVITFLPFKGPGSATRFRVDGRPRPEMGQEPSTAVRMIQPRYFETMGIPILRGRDFTEADLDPKAPLRFVVSDTMVKRMFPNEDPIGKRLVVNMKTDNEPGEIIGVVGDVRHGTLADKVNAFVYYPQSHLSFGFGTLVVQTSADPMAFASSVRQVIHRLDPDIPATEVATMQRWIEDSVARPRFQTGLLASFAGLALLLAVLGIYGVMSYAVAQRTHEIGVRMALGAQRVDVARLVLGRGVFLTLLGLAIGIAGALALGRYLETLLFEVKPADPATLAAVIALLLAVAIAACLLPARRATRVDPMVALHYE